MLRPIRVIDKRNKQYFMVDDVYLNGYARHLGPITSMVYISLCRHVDKEQTAFPSQQQIATEIGCGLRSVEDAIATLRRWNLIQVERDKTDRRWARNLYYLLDKEVWNKPSPASSAGVRSPANDDVDHPHQVLTKDTHTKDTHTLPIRDLSEDLFSEIADRYGVPVSFVKSKYEDMLLWAGERPNNPKLKNRNWKLTLMKWVKTDSFRVRKEAQYAGQKRGIDARGV